MKQLKYETSDTAKTQDLLNKQQNNTETKTKNKKKAEQYRTMDTAKKQNLLNKKAEQYRTMV